MATVVAATTTSRRGRGPRIGVALSATTLCAAIPGHGGSRLRAWRASIAPLNGEGSGWTALADALRALAREVGAADGRLYVALMPPLAELRGIELPPVGEREAQLLLVRGAGKYFAAARGPQVVGATRPARRAGGAGPQPVVAVAAPSRLVSAIHDAARDAGWHVESVVPAEAAWSAASATWSRRKASPQLLLVSHQDRTDLLRVEGGTLAGVRRFRAGGADAVHIAEATAGASTGVSAVGDPGVRRDLTQALAARGVSVEVPTSAVPQVAEEPDFLAAAFAIEDVSPRLVTEVERAARAHAQGQLARRIAIAAGALFLVAGLVEFWGVKRELGSVQAQRAELRPQLATTLVGRTTVETAYQQLAVLAEAERTAPEWSRVIAGITERLPLEAHLTGFRGQGDSVAVDGFASSAARVFDALDRVRGLSGVRATAPVRLETPSDGPPMERFTISARVGDAATTPRAGSPRTPAAGRGGAAR